MFRRSPWTTKSFHGIQHSSPVEARRNRIEDAKWTLLDRSIRESFTIIWISTTRKESPHHRMRLRAPKIETYQDF